MRASRLAGAISVSLLTAVRTAEPAVPSGFADEAVASVSAPTALAFAPDDRLLITTQPGLLRIYKAGALLPGSALDLRGRICSNSERGLLGVAVDPAFASNRFVYLYYTFNRNNNCGNSPVNRVARFVLGQDDTVDPGSEQVLIDNIHSTAGNHNGGDLRFGKDDLLYVSVGDGGCDYAGDSGCAGSNDASRDKHVLLGKVLRITRDGGIPSDNPFQGPGTGRCNLTGSTTPGNFCRETFAWGLRNPYRMAFDPDAAETRFFINDVGQNAWEEVDEAVAGADYGWNCREGAHTNSTTGRCAGLPPSSFRDPIHEYNRSAGCASITGGAFVPDGVWPAAYDADYLFADYVCGRMFRLTPNGSGWSASSFADQLGSVVALAFGPDGALYYSTYNRGVRRIRSTANRPPVARMQANPLNGPAPLTVAFDGSASSDPDPGDTIVEYAWDFGDGATQTTLAPMTTHVYATPGTYTGTLRVASGSPRQVSDPATVTIGAGNQPPVPVIVAPLPDERFAVGQALTLTGSATDPDEGVLGPDALSWTVVLHHADHTHPFLGPLNGRQVPLVYPAPEDLAAAANSFLEVRLTATDRFGAFTTVTRNLRPRTVDLTFATNPPGLQVLVNDVALRGPQTVTSWAAYVLTVDAPLQDDETGTSYGFASWSDGGPRRHTIVTPASATTLLATFTPFPRVTLSGTSVRERNLGSRAAIFTVALAAPSPGIALSFTTEDGTARAGEDYAAGTGVLTLPPGETRGTISVFVLGDRILEANETFRIRLSHPAYEGEATGTIRNDDAAVDWSGDGRADLLWQDENDGLVATWFMNDTTATEARLLTPPQAPPGGRIGGMGDFNDDGHPDLVWQTQAGLIVWLMQGTAAISTLVLDLAVPASWRLAGAADFDDNGKPDLLWRDTATGELNVWRMDGVTLVAVVPIIPRVVSTNWEIVGVPDWFDDGRPDILWREREAGFLALWNMDGLIALGASVLAMGVPPAWRPVGVADFDGNGSSDLVWQHDGDGSLGLWYRASLDFVDARPLVPGRVPTNWKIVGPR